MEVKCFLHLPAQLLQKPVFVELILHLCSKINYPYLRKLIFGLYSLPLIYVCVSLSTLQCLDYHSFVVSFKIRKVWEKIKLQSMILTLFFIFKKLLIPLVSLPLHINFNISLSKSTNILLRFL